MKTEYSYDNSGNQTSEIHYESHTTSSLWVSRSKTEYSYDSSGNQTNIISYQWNTTSSLWVSYSKSENVFDNAYFIKDVFGYWDGKSINIPTKTDYYDYSGNGFWIKSSTTIYHYSALDLVPPTAPTGLTILPNIDNSLTLSWMASTDFSGVTGYDVYKNGSLYQSTTETNLAIWWTGGTSDTIIVKAKDKWGNTSTSAPLYYSQVEIGMVGINSSNKNMVVWNKPQSSNIASFYIYRESNVKNVYNKIGTVSYDSLSVFTDEQSAPEVQSNKYKISVNSKSGMESKQSISHKTMHLSISKVIGTAWYLFWEAYEGFDVPTYNIYRGSTAANMTLIASTSGSNTQYTDINAPSGNLYYQLEIISPTLLNPTKVIGVATKMDASENHSFVTSQPYNVSRSNIASYITNSTAIKGNTAMNLEVYPNPTKGIVNIATVDGGNVNYTVCISNTLGQQVYTSNFNAEKTIIDLTKFGSTGIYFVQILDEKGIVLGRKKVVVQ